MNEKMDEKKKGMYRIGEYSRFMGVSADLLKHYEKQGLIRAQTAENGYRYYDFTESTLLWGSLSLRNYGFSLHEAQKLLNSTPFDEVQEQLDRKAEEIQARLRFEERVIAHQRKLSAWMENMRGKTLDVEEAPGGVLLYLPHSKEQDFIHDDRIAQLLEKWIAAMPMVKSGRLFPDVLRDNPRDGSMWGLVVTQEDAQALDLPVNDAVIRIEGGFMKTVHVHQPLEIHDGMPTYLEPALRLLSEDDRLGGGMVLQVMHMLPNNGEQREMCCSFMALLKSSC